MLVDTHCHLEFAEFDEDRAEILLRAAKNKISYIQTISTRISKFANILATTDLANNIYCSVGNHPCNVHEEKLTTAKELLQHAAHEKVISFGETGLDYYHDLNFIALQQQSFIEHIKASQISGLPVIVHTRDAEDDTIKILQEQNLVTEFKSVIHCFSGSLEFAKKCLDLGSYISLSGIVTFKSAKELQEITKFLPMDRILIETDAPYLAPVPHRGKRNEPSFVIHTANFIADLKNIDQEEFANISSQNFFNLFTKAKKL